MSFDHHKDPSCCRTRMQLIEAGLEELSTYGYLNFSTRRVAKKCGVSCAAPYKHFEDTTAFIMAILQHINDLYIGLVQSTLAAHADDTTEGKLIAIAMAYIAFAVEHPDYYNIASRIPSGHPASAYNLSSVFSDIVYSLVDQFFAEYPAEPDDRERILFLTRSVVYSSALLFTNGQMEYNEKNRQMVSDLLFREAHM